MLTVHIQKTNEGHGSSGIGIHAGFHLQKEAHIAHRKGIESKIYTSDIQRRRIHPKAPQQDYHKPDIPQETTSGQGLQRAPSTDQSTFCAGIPYNHNATSNQAHNKFP